MMIYLCLILFYMDCFIDYEVMKKVIIEGV